MKRKQGHPGSLMALQQRKLMRFDSLKYIRSACPHNYIDRLIEALDAGKNIIIEFGSQSNMLFLYVGN